MAAENTQPVQVQAQLPPVQVQEQLPPVQVQAQLPPVQVQPQLSPAPSNVAPVVTPSVTPVMSVPQPVTAVQAVDPAIICFCPILDLQKQTAVQRAFGKEIGRLSQLKQDDTFDNIFDKQRNKDLERYWYLKSQPIDIDPSERLYEKKPLMSLIQLQEPQTKVPIHVNKLCDAVIKAQPLSKQILKKNALKKPKPPPPPEPAPKSSAPPRPTSLLPPTTPKALFRVSLASGGFMGQS